MVQSQSHLERPPSTEDLNVEDLNGLGNSLFCFGNKTGAILSFDSALRMVHEKCSIYVESPSGSGHNRSIEEAARESQSHQSNIVFQLPPDAYFEGECDVGPRPLHSPLHLSFSSIHSAGTPIIESILLYNKGVVHHSDGDNENAKKAYGIALTLLHKVSSSSTIELTSIISCLSHLGTLLHNNLGHIHYLDGEEQESLFHFQTGLSMSKQVISPGNEQDWDLTVATVTSNLARTLWMTNEVRNDTTLQLFQDVLRLRSLWMPEYHPDILCAHLNLGLLLYVRHDTKAAMYHLQKYLKFSCQEHVLLDPIPAIAHVILIENENKDDPLSTELVRIVRAMLDAREDYGEITAEVASLLNYIGTILFHRRELEYSIIFYKQELRLENMLSEDACGINISVTYNNIGRILQELGNLNEAIECYRQALKPDGVKSTMNLCSHDSDNFPVKKSDTTLNLYSTIWYNLGLIYDRMGSRSESILAFKMSLKLRQSLYGNDHQDVACLWYNIGTLEMEVHCLDDSFVSLKEAVRIKRMGSFKEDTSKIIDTLSKLATLQENKGCIDQALATHSEILQLHFCPANAHYTEAISKTLVKMSDLKYACGAVAESLDMAQQSLEYLLRSNELFTENVHHHLRHVETVADRMLMIGSLHHELTNEPCAMDMFGQAHSFVTEVVRQYGTVVTPRLASLLDALRILMRPSCAPQA